MRSSTDDGAMAPTALHMNNNTNGTSMPLEEKSQSLPLPSEQPFPVIAGNPKNDEEAPSQPLDSQPLDNDSEEPLPLARWNDSRLSMFRYFVTIYSFLIMGMNDGVTGALIPYIEPYYNLSYTVVSLLFLSSFVGYLLAAISSNVIHHKMGQLGVAVLGPVTRLVGYITLACHPPFPVLPVIMLFPGFGNGIEDSGWNSWVGNLQNANELLGIMHGTYGLGGTIAPLISTSMITKGHLQWYTFYYIMIGLTAVEFVLGLAAFWGATGRVHRENHKPESGEAPTSTRKVMKAHLTWLIAVFLLGYVGVEVSLGGWIVTFMLQYRHAPNFDAGMAATGFWLGITVGRVALGFITGRIGEKLAVTAYLLMAVVLQLLYWQVPSFVASCIFVAFVGFCLGPLFPAAIVVATKLLPTNYHVAAIGFAAALGGGGGAVLPFVVGAIAQSKGVQVLQPIVVAILGGCIILWLLMPGGLRPGGLENARKNNEPIGYSFKVVFNWLQSKLFRQRLAVVPGAATI